METANPIQIKVEEELYDENAGRTITLSSVGGTDLSVFLLAPPWRSKALLKMPAAFLFKLLMLLIP